MRFTVERLQNGLLRVFDRSCEWDILYDVRSDGYLVWQHGGVDSIPARRAVREFLAHESQSLRQAS